MLNKQLVYLDYGIYLGNWESCSIITDIPMIIHISDGESLCKTNNFQWNENDKLSSKMMDVLTPMIIDNEEVLIHCQSGLNRGPTIAFFALLLKGMSVSEAYVLIANRMLNEYAIQSIPCWNYNNLRCADKYARDKRVLLTAMKKNRLMIMQDQERHQMSLLNMQNNGNK